MATIKAAPRATKVPELRRGDTVVVLTGKDAGKRGTVERVVRTRRASRRPTAEATPRPERT